MTASAKKKLTLYSHTGTHIDAPAHIIAGTPTLDQLPLKQFCDRACVLDCTRSDAATVTLTDLHRRADLIRAHAFVILHTGWSRYWGQQRYFSGYPVLSGSAARWLADQGLTGIGVDAISADPAGSTRLAVHTILLGAGMVIVENLTNLAMVPDASFLFSCLPLKIKDADGSPVRAVAMVPC